MWIERSHRLPPLSLTSFLNFIRRTVKSFLLRGPFGRWWIDRKIRRVDRIYLAELVRASNDKLPEPTRPNLRLARPVRRIAIIGNFLWEANDLIPELQRFLEVQAFDLNPALRSAPPDETSADTVVRAIRDYLKDPSLPEPDLLLLYALPGFFSEELFAMLRARWKCPFVGMNLDEKVTFLPEEVFKGHNGGYVRWAPLFDINLTNALAVTDWYRSRSLPVIYMPQGFRRPDFPPPANTPHYDFELTFLGARKIDRERIVNELFAAGVPVHLFGKGWPGSQWVDDAVSVFRRSQMNLGIGFATSGLTNVKGRDFECPGAGACYLTTYNWELAPFFENGREILMYREVPELIEMFSYYRRRPELCAAIARAAYTRSIREHTWEKRFRDLLQTLGILAS